MIYPLVGVILITLLYVGYSDYKYIKESTYQQVENNLDISNEYLNQHVKAANNQLYLLGETYKYDYDITDFLISAQYLLNSENKYLEIGLLTADNEYFGTNYVYNGNAAANISRPWYSEHMTDNESFVSPLYKSSQTQRWAVAIVHLLKLNNGESARVIVELDILSLYDKLSLLKTLMNGYVYAVDRKTGEIVMHPDPARISTKSISVSASLLQYISDGTNTEKVIRYTYKGQNKFSIYNNDNKLGWLLLSNSSNADIKQKAFNIGAVSLALLSILITIILIVFISNRVHNKGQLLSESTILEEIYLSLSQMVSELFRFDKLFLFVHNPYNQKFEEPVYNISLDEIDVYQEISSSKVQVLKIANPLISEISPKERCARIPLYNKGEILGVIYLTNTNLRYLHFINIFRNYAQSALINMLLTQKIRSEDSMTQLMNKRYLRQQMANQIRSKTPSTYLAMIDIDDFKVINDTYGHLFGDRVIIKTAKMLKHFFNNKAVTSRYGGEEFAVLFHANSNEEALKRLDEFRYSIETLVITSEQKSCKLTLSIGFSALRSSVDNTIYDADKALYRAKKTTKNKVEQSI